MNTDSTILEILQRMLKLQEETHAIQKLSYELQQKAIEKQSLAIKNQLATGRIYRIALVVTALVILAFIFLLVRISH